MLTQKTELTLLKKREAPALDASSRVYSSDFGCIKFNEGIYGHALSIRRRVLNQQ